MSVCMHVHPGKQKEKKKEKHWPKFIDTLEDKNFTLRKKQKQNKQNSSLSMCTCSSKHTSIEENVVDYVWLHKNKPSCQRFNLQKTHTYIVHCLILKIIFAEIKAKITHTFLFLLLYHLKD